MTATGHAVIGTVIAAKIGNPAFAIPLAIASHIAADIFPHWDTATNIHKKGTKRVIVETVFDVIVGFVISYAIVFFLFPKTNYFYVFILIISSQSLDWLMALYRLFNINFALFRWSYYFQKSFNHSLDKPWGIINQIVVLVLLVIVAKLL